MPDGTSPSQRFDHILSCPFHAVVSSGRNSQRAFLVVCLSIFAVSASLTAIYCMTMSPMGNMSMPGGGTMSMVWTRMPEQTWLSVAASFVGMWVPMMIAMMLPSIAPVLWEYRRTMKRTSRKRLDYLTSLIAFGYFFVWTILGIAVFVVGTLLATLEMRSPTLASTEPLIAGLVVVIAGLLQLTGWKARQLASCHNLSGHDPVLPLDLHSALKGGLRLGLHCVLCCVGLTAVLLVSGIMNLFVIAIVAIAITLERVAPAPRRVAQAIGLIMIATGLILIAHIGGPDKVGHANQAAGLVRVAELGA